MQIIRYPEKAEWKKICKRPAIDMSALEVAVTNILKEVKENGDQAVRRFTGMFDKVSVTDLQVSQSEIKEAASLLSPELRQAIEQARRNIELFHAKQLNPVEVVETMPGVRCWRKCVAIEKVGLYIPGGTAPLFSTLLMLAVPARLAGSKEIVLCSPANKEKKIHPAILYAAQLTGVTKIYKTGGAQAIGAMAYGTETIPQVYKIFGPGNQYVTCAKQLIQKDGVPIDMPAGPSEVAVYADESARVPFVAADLLSQAEHGSDSQVMLVCTTETVIEEVIREVENQLLSLPRKEFAQASLENSRAILVRNEREAIDLLNEYAAEHLILSCRNADELAEKVINAGSVFLGHYSPESVGDYASGTNHTLPTNGYAKAYSGVSVDSFLKKITFQHLTEEGLRNIGPAVELMAEAEGLLAHKRAVTLRLQ
ncbi:MAG: histidinol dehydrogenase [Williamsia sp.]|nr:histidinol dehydrogenase [Williamsia sp.]